MNCSSTSLEQFIDLGNQPNGNNFPKCDELSKEEMHTTIMQVCTDCWQVQIKEFPSVQSMFFNHPYLTGLNKPVISHFKSLVCNILKKYNLPPHSLVLDIGANDGSLLSIFQKKGFKTLGVDPCKNITQIATDSGIEIINTFWNTKSANKLKNKGITPQLITATNVFYHIDDINDFVKGLNILMDKNTIFCAQCVYLKDIITNLQFDHFYHEHTMIHAIGPLKRLFKAHGFRIIDIDLYPINGGSFVLYVCKESATYKSSDVKINKIIEDEVRAGLTNLDTYHNFAKKVAHNKNVLKKLLKELKSEGKTIAGIGAPLKSSTLLNYCKIGPELLDYITEINPIKINRFTPGTHIPIVSESNLNTHPDYYLLLTWNFKNFFIDKYKEYLMAGGKIITPHPEVQVIDKSIFN